MDARGFDSGLPRTYARRQVFARPDLLLVLGAAALTAGALTAAVLFGVFRPILG
jgi:energy-coupling factor transport system permease protein